MAARSILMRTVLMEIYELQIRSLFIHIIIHSSCVTNSTIPSPDISLRATTTPSPSFGFGPVMWQLILSSFRLGFRPAQPRAEFLSKELFDHVSRGKRLRLHRGDESVGRGSKRQRRETEGNNSRLESVDVPQSIIGIDRWECSGWSALGVSIELPVHTLVDYS